MSPSGNQLEIKARLLSQAASTKSWGLVVFGSADLKAGTKIGFNSVHFFVDRRNSGSTSWSPPVEKDVRAGPIPQSTTDQSIHVFLDRSIISAIASNETAITVWTHPQDGSVALGLFADGETVDVELEVLTMGSI